MDIRVTHELLYAMEAIDGYQQNGNTYMFTIPRYKQ